MSQTTIRSYFETKLATYAAAHSLVLKVAYENAPFTPPSSGTYLEAYLLPAYTLNPFVSATHKREGGIFQVSVVGEAAKGTKALYDVAQEIVNLFPVVPKDNAVSVEQTPHIAKVFKTESGKIALPVSIMYRLES